MRRFSFIAFIFMALLPLFGQEGEGVTRATISTLAWEKPVSGLFYLNDGEVVELKAYTGGFSMPIEYVGAGHLAFYSDRAAFNPELENRPPPVAVATLPVGVKEVMLIFIPTEAGRYNVLVWDASTKNFPAKSFRILNLSPSQVMLALGEKPNVYEINPNSMQIIHLDDVTEEKQMEKVQIAQVDGDEMELVYRSKWLTGTETRSTVFVLPRPGDSGGVKVMKFIQRGI